MGERKKEIRSYTSLQLPHPIELQLGRKFLNRIFGHKTSGIYFMLNKEKEELTCWCVHLFIFFKSSQFTINKCGFVVPNCSGSTKPLC